MPQPHDIICLSHLRWNFVFQRPNHLMSRCARSRRVFFVEEPLFDGGPPRLTVEQSEHGPFVVVPHFSRSMEPEKIQAHLPRMMDKLLEQQRLRDYALWYYTPMALEFTRHLTPRLAVYDCMDELSAFRDAPGDLLLLERELFERVDLVFTGGQSLYEAKRHEHPNVFAFPSSVDVRHFQKARQITTEPKDQAQIPRPRIGYFGVIDERLDLDLVAELARIRPHWHFVMVGPLAKLEESQLPQANNLHWLGGKDYAELPQYLAGWDSAFMPFALNDATRFISPTKTPEFLAAGRAVVSTPIADVVEPYGNRGLVRIADTAQGFAEAIEEQRREEPSIRIGRADSFLARMSWDQTWEQMSKLMDQAQEAPKAANDDSEKIIAAS
jgi:UDP-galactopyranose mutase